MAERPEGTCPVHGRGQTGLSQPHVQPPGPILFRRKREGAGARAPAVLGPRGHIPGGSGLAPAEAKHKLGRRVAGALGVERPLSSLLGSARWPSPAFLCTACPSARSGHGLARVTLAEALPVRDTCPNRHGTHRRCLTLRRSGMLREKGRGAPYFTVGKAKAIQGGLGFWTTVPRVGGLGVEGGATWVSLPSLQDTPGGNWSHMWGLEALPRKQAQLAPDPASRHHVPPHPQVAQAKSM